MSIATKTLAQDLATLGADGSFAARRRAPADDLEITVVGVGKVALPITPSVAAALCAVARPSPYGLGAATLHDASVRNSSEIAASRLIIGTRRWNPALAAHLTALAADLGIPEGCCLVADLDKLLVYERGQFFKTHQDSERSDDMIGTLLVVLPSDHAGGTLSVARGAEKKSFSRAQGAAKDLSLIAFYADCRHEISPVTRGVRVALSYRLRIERPPGAGAAVIPEKVLERITRGLRAHFETPIAPSYGNGEALAPERLVYLLDHEYSQRSLGWNRLKHDDAVRVAALREAARRLDCECFLALAEVHETWSCEDDGSSRRRGWYRRDEDEDDDGDGTDESDAYDLVELLTDDIELTHWIGAGGKLVKASRASVAHDELCFSVPSGDLEPFKSEHEGYQGNYGNTVDRWYHRAAFIAWPRANAIVLLAAAAPEDALDQLLAVPAGDSARLASLVGRLLPRWKRCVGTGDGAGVKVAAKVLRVARRLSDAKVVASWIEPIGAAALSSKAVRSDFVALVAAYGASWGCAVLEGWTQRRHAAGEPSFPALAETCLAFEAAGSAACSKVAAWLLEREVAAALDEFGPTLKAPVAWLDGSRFDREAAVLVTLLEVAVAMGRDAAVERMERFVAGAKTVVPLWFRVRVLTEGLAGSPALRSRLDGSALHRACIDDVEAMLRVPPRAANDWSIDCALPCACADCAGLVKFLRSSAPALDWPMAQHRRQHLHGCIDASGLPLSHKTLRVGSPQVLQLRKLPSLFTKEAAHRAKLAEALRALSGPSDAGSRPPAEPPAKKRRKA